MNVLLCLWLISDLGATPYAKHLKEVVAGYSFGAIGWCVGVNLANAVGEEAAIPIGGYSLYGLSSSIGVWKIGNQYDEGGYVPTLVGTVALPLVIIGIAKACGMQLSTMNELVWVSLPLGSFIGYNLSIKREKEKREER